MKRLLLVTLGPFLIAGSPAQEAPKPRASSAEAVGHQATREEMQQRFAELMAFAVTTGAQGNATRRERGDEDIARQNRIIARGAEMNRLEAQMATGDETAAKKFAELRKEKAADDAAWKQLTDNRSAASEKLKPWNREFELTAGSVLKGKGVLESGTGLSTISANLEQGQLVYRWQGPAEGGKPELQLTLTFLPMPPNALAHFGNPTRKIGGTGTVMIEREHMAAAVFEKFQMSVELGAWKEGGKTPLEVAAQAIDFDALGALKVAMTEAEPAKLDRTLPRLPLEVKRPTGSALPREEQLKTLEGFLREASELKKQVAEIEKEEREERDRVSLRNDESGADALSDEIDRLRRRARAGETGLDEAIAAAKKERIALVEKNSAPLRAIEDKKIALLHEAELKNPRFAEVAASMVAPGTSLPDGVGLARIDAHLDKGHMWLHWDTLPGGQLPSVTVFLQLFHRPDGFEKANPVKSMIHDKWPVIIEEQNNTRIWLHELQVDVSVSPEWQARGIKPKDLAESILDFDALGTLDATAAP